MLDVLADRAYGMTRAPGESDEDLRGRIRVQYLRMMMPVPGTQDAIFGALRAESRLVSFLETTTCSDRLLHVELSVRGRWGLPILWVPGLRARLEAVLRREMPVNCTWELR